MSSLINWQVADARRLEVRRVESPERPRLLRRVTRRSTPSRTRNP